MLHQTTATAHQGAVDQGSTYRITKSGGAPASAAALRDRPDAVRTTSGPAPQLDAKRAVDVVVAALALAALSPLIAVVALLVAMDGGPVLFSHVRLGRRLRAFGCLKFRTMILGADVTLKEYLLLNPAADEQWKREQKLSFDARVTPVGRILRRTSLDELPQLVNVLRGEMSLVGPRPVTGDETERYGAALPLYASVRPGVTGLWQVSGRNDVSYDGRVALDARYVLEGGSLRGFLRDLAILFVATPRVIISRKGAR